MDLTKWLKNKLKGGRSSRRIYCISNFEAHEADYELYVEHAKKITSEEDLNIDMIYGTKHTNVIRTAKYKVYSFIPQVVFFQFLRLGNLYFLSISLLQLIPEITDSHGMPTYLIPLFFIIVVAMIKEFFEDWQRHKSDNEENNKKTMVFENGILKEKTWAQVRDGDVVKIFAYEYFPADLVLLNCSNSKGIVNIETKNVDGESNVKHKFCIPQISKYFSDDSSAGFCRMEIICESPNDNIFEFTGNIFLPPLQYKENERLVRFYLKEENKTSTANVPRIRHKTFHIRGRHDALEKSEKVQRSTSQIIEISKNQDRLECGKLLEVVVPSEDGKDGEEEEEEEVAEEVEEENKRKGKIGKKWSILPANLISSTSRKSNVEDPAMEKKKRHLSIAIAKGRKKKKKKEKKRDLQTQTISVCIDNVVLRGTSLVNTKWIYGLVINTGNRTKLMKNVSTKSRHKWSRLEYVYGNHVIVLIIIQICISLFVAIGGVIWMQYTGNHLWYLNIENQVSSIKTFFITIGAMILLFGSFIPVDLLLIWEVVRLLQGYLINWDDDMFSKKTGKHALSKAGQLLEEMGNVTHIYSDKTGTLTQNVMQLQNIGLGNNGTYGFYDFDNIKEHISRGFSASGSIFWDADVENIYQKEKVKSDYNIKSTLHISETKHNVGAFISSDSELLSVESAKGDAEKKRGVQLLHPKALNTNKNTKRSSQYTSAGSYSYEQIYTEEDFVREENAFVCFNRVLFANKIYHNRCATEQALYCLLVFSLCHSAMIRNVEIDEVVKESVSETEEKCVDVKSEEEQEKGKGKTSVTEKIKEGENLEMSNEHLNKKKRLKSDTSEVPGKRKIYDEESGVYYTYLTKPQPQYDASSPDELALICTSLYLGCEFVNRPDLRTIEIELTSTFAQRLILGDETFEKFRKKKSYYENNFYTYFPEVAMKEEMRKNSKRNTNNHKRQSNRDIAKLAMKNPLKNIFGPNKNNDNDEQECDESTRLNHNGRTSNTNNNGDTSGNSGEISGVNNMNSNSVNSSRKNVNKADDETEMGKNALDEEVIVIVPVLSYEILDVLSFDNVRKRMSIIVKNEKNEIYMLTKGADASVLKMARGNQENMVSHVQHQLNIFANSGLRTLVLGYKHMTVAAFEKMHTCHMHARNAMGTNKEEILQKFYNEAEKDLIIIGCTGIDDKLQDDVPQVIEDLREAGMTICVLTGDKLETAINIGYSINILNKNTYNAILIDTDPDVLLEQIKIHEKNTDAANLIFTDKDTNWWVNVKWENLSLDIQSDTMCDFMKTHFNVIPRRTLLTNKTILDKKDSLPTSMLKQEKIMHSFIESDVEAALASGDYSKTKRMDSGRHYSQFAITVTGEALATISSNKFLKIKFYTLARSASTLIACRVTPKQKSLLVKENSAFNPKGTSLAIGDGANDVGMILMANVGVGIEGKEGMQAARSSDFTISEFKYLKKLLFVHGRESLRRNSFLVYFCIFRNVSFCLCSMVLIFLSGYSAIDAWNPWTKQIINIAFTSLPVILFVALDKQLPHDILLNNPVLYETTPSTLWPIARTHDKLIKVSEFCKKCAATMVAVICYPFKLISPFQKPSRNVKLWLGKKPKTEYFRCYGTQFFVVYFLYAIWLAVTETLFIIYFATGQDYSPYNTFKSVDVDFHTFSQILYTHHALAVNAVVVILTNRWFLIFHAVLIFEVLFLFMFWFVISKWHLFLDIVGADDLHGTFENAHRSSNYYSSLLMTLYVALLPLLLLCTYQFMKKPTMEQIVSEQLRLGVFEGIRKHIIQKLAYVDDIQVSKKYVNYGFAFAVEAKDAFFGIVQKAVDKIKYPLKRDAQPPLTAYSCIKRQ